MQQRFNSYWILKIIRNLVLIFCNFNVATIKQKKILMVENKNVYGTP